ncbi:MAG: hypothetical protein AB7T63_08780 [Planctomycetota bacterium]
MVSLMQTTLEIEGATMRRLTAEARRQGRTVSELAEVAFRQFLQSVATQAHLPDLPRFRGGRLLVDLGDRDRLYRAMEE